jgi:hypothetical protein
MRPVVPKSDARGAAERIRDIKKRKTLCIAERIPSFPKMRKGIRDALFLKL